MPSLATNTFVKSVGTDDAAEEVVSNVMEITIHAEGKIIPITLTNDKCTSTSWGTLCKEVVQRSLMVQESDLMLKILTKLSPNNELHSHYLLRYGDGHATIFRVAWSKKLSGSANLESGYAEANMVLKPRGEGRALDHGLLKPHRLVRPLGVEYHPTALEMDLCIKLVSTTQQPFPYDKDLVSVVFLREHESIPGCLGSFNVVAGDGKNDILPESPSAIVTANTIALTPKEDRKSPSTAKTASSNSKNSKKEGNGAKKPPTEEGKRGAAATTVVTELKSPPKRIGVDLDMVQDMIRLYKESKAKETSSNVGVKVPLEEEKLATKTPPNEADSETAVACNKKRTVPTDVESSGTSKSPSEKKSKTLKVDMSSTPLEASLDDVEKDFVANEEGLINNLDGLTNKRPCGKCWGCLEMPCRKCTSCESKKRCEKRKCSDPKKTTMAEYEAWNFYAEMARNGDTQKVTAALAAVEKRGPKPNPLSDIPPHPATDLPDGWTTKLVPRSGSGRLDRKWFSPGGIHFRQLNLAKCFIDIVGTEKDEARAYEVYQQLQHSKRREQMKKSEQEKKEKSEQKKMEEEEVSIHIVAV